MRSDAPPLMPIFRSRHQADLLTYLLLRPDRDRTVSDLARELDVPLTTLSREAQRLVEAGILTAGAVGRSTLLRANTSHRAYRPLVELLTVTFGPHVVLSEEFSGVTGAERVLIHGSWASRYAGMSGSVPHDVDVLVVGTPDRAAVYEAAERAEQRLGFPVNPTIRSPKIWREAGDALIQQIISSPTVVVLDQNGDEVGHDDEPLETR